MAANDIPKSIGQLTGLGTNMLAGLTALGTTLGMTQIPVAMFRSALADFMDASVAFNARRSATQSASSAWMAAAGAVEAWLGVARNVLAGRFGNRWSPLWAQAGFINPTTALPKRIEDRLALAFSLATFFTTHADYEVPGMGVTAARAMTLRATALAAQQALAAAAADQKTQGDAAEAARKTLVRLMRSLIKVLAVSIEGNDPRWLQFGLQMPATRTTPGQPVAVSATLDAGGGIVVQCDAVPLATRYRWRTRLVGVQPDYQLAASTTAPMGMLDPAPAGRQVEIIVQAVNGGSQGVASEPVVFTMPTASVRSEVAEAVPGMSAPEAPHRVPPRIVRGSPAPSPPAFARRELRSE